MILNDRLFLRTFTFNDIFNTHLPTSPLPVKTNFQRIFHDQVTPSDTEKYFMLIAFNHIDISLTIGSDVLVLLTWGRF